MRSYQRMNCGKSEAPEQTLTPPGLWRRYVLTIHPVESRSLVIDSPTRTINAERALLPGLLAVRHWPPVAYRHRCEHRLRWQTEQSASDIDSAIDDRAIALLIRPHFPTPIVVGGDDPSLTTTHMLLERFPRNATQSGHEREFALKCPDGLCGNRACPNCTMLYAMLSSVLTVRRGSSATLRGRDVRSQHLDSSSRRD